jgi:hypothetical protein
MPDHTVLNTSIDYGVPQAALLAMRIGGISDGHRSTGRTPLNEKCRTSALSIVVVKGELGESLRQHGCQLARGDHVCQLRKIAREHPVVINRRTRAANRRIGFLQTSAGLERREKVDGLRRCCGFDREHMSGVGDYALEL